MTAELLDLEDPFTLPSESKVTARTEIITGGRYRLPRRDGSHKPYGWMRVTNLVSAYSDQFALRMWEIQQALQGIQMSPDLYAELLATDFVAMDNAARKAWAEEFTERCKLVAGGAEGSRHGIYRHAVVEEHHAGLPTGHHAADVRRHLSLYASALVRNQLRALPDMQERRVLVEELEVVGTLDNVLEDLVSGMLLIGDLKTQRRFWTWLEIAAQLATYAHADAMWDVAAGAWVDMPPVDRSRALVLWMPRIVPDPENPEANLEPRVDVYEVDVEAGWQTAHLAYKVVKDRAAGKAARKPRGWLRPAPPITMTEQYAARFAAVDTRAEGSALVDEAIKAGVWSPVLADCAKAAVDRLRGLTATKK